MSTGIPSPVRPTAEQARAADPARSVWVAASAGTGKTAVLTDRVLRLLLAGAPPESILCLTFTKAAASEMTLRVERRLAHWASAADPVLADELATLTGAPPTAELMARARRLFAQALELQQGLPIMTIHALAATLLRRFPLESATPPHFETLDERSAALLLAEARSEVLARGAAEPETDAALARSLRLLAVALSESSLTEALQTVLAERQEISAAIDRHGGLDGLVRAIWQSLDVEPTLTEDAVIQRVSRDGEHDAAALLPAARALAASAAPTDRTRGEALFVWLNAIPADRERLFDEHCVCFLTKELTPLVRLGTKAVAREHILALGREQARLAQACAQLKGLRIAARSEALLRVGVAAIDAYERRKLRTGALDYDDLIDRARRLLERPGGAQWVLYKLDQEIRHLLVDEAQDTSPGQWAIVERLVDEFYASAPDVGRPRTLFVVGDEKQSIYGFQGADLDSFRAVRARLRERAGPALAEIGLDLSFRSTPAVLELVDAVFAHPLAASGVAETGAELRHRAFRATAAGLVELWPLIEPADREDEDEPWPLPGEVRATDEPLRQLAEAIAQRIAAMLAPPGEPLESAGRPIAAADILILLARRGALQELIIRALRRQGVPVAGVDRLGVTAHIAVKDLLALGRVALLPEDDLSLACLLKSPLIGLTEEELFTLAHGRGRQTLFERLRTQAEAAPLQFGQAHDRLVGWLNRADFTPPFEFFTSVLGEADAQGRTGRQRLQARLGSEANEPIEAFLGQALAFEAGHPASLQGFLGWLDTLETELRRDPETAADAVRVMTVHGAKGLEAPIVLLADAGPRRDPSPCRLVWHRARRLPYWRAPKSERDPVTEEACGDLKQRQAEERQRLLYVALTRARDRLYIAGCRGGQPRDPENAEQGTNAAPCWHDHVARALDGLDGVEAVALGPAFPGPGRRRQRGAPQAPTPAAAEGRWEPSPPPAWLRRPAPAEPARRHPLSPSRLATGTSAGEATTIETGGSGDPWARQQGILVHRLLQLVPALPAHRWAGAVARLAQELAPELPASERARAEAAALAVLAMPELAPLFGPRARSEQAIAGCIDGVPVSGQIDRFVVLEGEVLCVDFKTGRQVPATLEEVPPAYLAQLTAYRRLLGSLHPQRIVRCGLVWTAGPSLLWLPVETGPGPAAAPP